MLKTYMQELKRFASSVLSCIMIIGTLINGNVTAFADEIMPVIDNKPMVIIHPYSDSEEGIFKVESSDGSVYFNRDASNLTPSFLALSIDNSEFKGTKYDVNNVNKVKFTINGQTYDIDAFSYLDGFNTMLVSVRSVFETMYKNVIGTQAVDEKNSEKKNGDYDMYRPIGVIKAEQYDALVDMLSNINSECSISCVYDDGTSFDSLVTFKLSNKYDSDSDSDSTTDSDSESDADTETDTTTDTVTDTETDTSTDANTDTETDTLKLISSVTVEKWGDKDIYEASETMIFTDKIVNTSNTTLHNVIVTENYDGEFDYVEDVSANGNTAVIDKLESGEEIVLIYRVKTDKITFNNENQIAVTSVVDVTSDEGANATDEFKVVVIKLDVPNTDTETNTDTNTETDTNTNTDPDSDTTTDTDTNTDSTTDTDTDSDSGSDSTTESDTVTDTDTNTDTNTDSNSGRTTDTDTSTDTNTNKPKTPNGGTSTPTTTAIDETKKSEQIKTGDCRNIGILIAVFGSAFTVMLVTFKRKKEEK